MTMIAQEMTHGRSLSAWVAETRETVTKWRLYRRTVRQLNALAFAELEDLGIARADIPQVAAEAVYGKAA